MASSIVPGIYHPEELDGVLPMPTDAAWDVSERLAGGGAPGRPLVGRGAGGRLRMARGCPEGKPGVIVTVFPDRADRYFEAPAITQASRQRGNPVDERYHPMLTPEALAEMYAHARREYPNECCGIVFGPRDQPVADRSAPAPTSRTSCTPRIPSSTRATPDRLQPGRRRPVRAAEEPARRRAGEDRVPLARRRRRGAYFSDTDQAAAQMDGEPTYPVEYVVIDVTGRRRRGAAQFAWDDGRARSTSRSPGTRTRRASTSEGRGPHPPSEPPAVGSDEQSSPPPPRRGSRGRVRPPWRRPLPSRLPRRDH